MSAHIAKEMGRKARAASRLLASASPSAKNLFLQNLARLLMDHRKDILAVNAKDVEKARLPLENDTVWLRIDYCFTPSEGDLTEPDTATVYTSYDGQDWQSYDYSLKMRFTLDYFTGYRTGLYCYSTGGDGGYADFDFFRQSVTD